MNARQERFVQEYLVDLNGKQAAIRAGYSEKGAAVTASQLLTNHNVAVAIAAGRARLADRLEVTQERVVAEYARLAFTDMRDAARWGDDIGLSLVNSDELTPDVAAAVKSVRVVKTTTRGKDDYETERIEHRIEMHDKKGALDSLAKHLGMFGEGPTAIANAVAIVVQRSTPELRGNG